MVVDFNDYRMSYWSLDVHVQQILHQDDGIYAILTTQKNCHEDKALHNGDFRGIVCVFSKCTTKQLQAKQ
jgi:hypothetical protein